jgi:hypothetical protein
MKALRIYIARPYTASSPYWVSQNVLSAIDASVEMMRLGHLPYCPHLSHYVDRRAKNTGVGFGYKDWMTLDLAWLEQCEALLYLGSSPGADRELDRATELGLTIYYSVAEVTAAK